MMAGYDREQLDVIRTIKHEANRRYANDPVKRRRYTLTQLEISSVESNHRNLPGGDADSAGYRQERASLYKDPQNLKAAVNRAFDEMEQHDRGQTTGILAADVQRPRADLRGKYQTRLAEARALAGGGTNPAQTRTARAGKAPTLTRGGTKTDTRGAVQAALLDPRKKMSLLSRIRGELTSGNHSTTTLPVVTSGTVQTARPAPAGDKIAARASAIDARKSPYKWGGGHGDNSGLYDCSGAVSKILGISPRVASQFKTWGKAGRDPSGKLTIYANEGHVLAEINGRFWGTSKTNPGGGPGWIKRSDVPASYLARFTARHA